MPLSFQVRTKPVSFLWGMVTGEFAANNSFLAQFEAQQLYKRIIDNYPGMKDAPDEYLTYVDRYTDCVTYTQSLSFNWAVDTADEFRGLERVWTRILRGDDPAECFGDFAQLSTLVIFGYKDAADDVKPEPKKENEAPIEKPPSKTTFGWHAAQLDALSIWTPLDTRPAMLLTEAERADPN